MPVVKSRDARDIAPVGSYLRCDGSLVRVLEGDAAAMTVENVSTGYPFSIDAVDLAQRWTRVTPASDEDTQAWVKQTMHPDEAEG